MNDYETMMVSDLRPGDLFYLTEGEVKGRALCVWTVEQEAFISVGGGIMVPGHQVGYLTGGHLIVRTFKDAKEVVLWRP